MDNFFEGMTALLQTYWITALIGTGLFLIIFIMTFIGGSGDADMVADSTEFDADDGGVGFQFFTFKNVVAFFTIFGWTGIICIEHEYSSTFTILISSLAGLITMLITSSLFFYMAKLAQSGTLNIQKAKGLIGEVYLPIGAKRSSIGKIQLKVQGSLRELEAITDHEEDLPTSSIIKVKEVVSAELLLVEKLTQ
ncbi:MAG: hypothetical protein DWP98_14225 [Bacteroidetes bacterium]|nr:MAG: hypothetical protein DWP98_14225 [Bacteroidota bacterium]MBL1145349.1 hypothetical protein [Bacteroidota bacterium]MCB0801880.1 hypothetical protein [Flavobacteriales bacterium]NOG58147.1 hypothetical protein [Bacteroidota bacterium]